MNSPPTPAEGFFFFFFLQARGKASEAVIECRNRSQQPLLLRERVAEAMREDKEKKNKKREGRGEKQTERYLQKPHLTSQNGLSPTALGPASSSSMLVEGLTVKNERRRLASMPLSASLVSGAFFSPTTAATGAQLQRASGAAAAPPASSSSSISSSSSQLIAPPQFGQHTRRRQAGEPSPLLESSLLKRTSDAAGEEPRSCCCLCCFCCFCR